MAETTGQKPLTPEFQKRDDFTKSYANHVQLLSTNWDLELLFGQIDSSQGPNVVIQHESVTLPWAQAKLLLYFLRSHVEGHEAEFGRLVIPPGIVPKIAAKLPPEFEGIGQEKWNLLRKNFEDFIAANPEAAGVEGRKKQPVS